MPRLEEAGKGACLPCLSCLALLAWLLAFYVDMTSAKARGRQGLALYEGRETWPLTKRGDRRR